MVSSADAAAAARFATSIMWCSQTSYTSHAGIPGVSHSAQNNGGNRDGHMIRKGQVKWLPKDYISGQVVFINSVFGIVASG